MTNSKNLAGLLGPTLIALSLSEALNLHIWTSVIAPIVYLSGTLIFIAGLSIVRAHNRWKLGWPLVVTLIGWFGIVGGLIRMFAPEFAQRQSQDTTSVLALLIVLFVIGVFLSFKAYVQKDT